MGSPSLQLDMEDESSELLLEEGFLNQLKDKYCCRLKVSHMMTERGHKKKGKALKKKQ